VLNAEALRSVHQFIISMMTKLPSSIRSVPAAQVHSSDGTAYLVYPGATHSRFEHSLGVLELQARFSIGWFSKFPKLRPDYRTGEKF